MIQWNKLVKSIEVRCIEYICCYSIRYIIYNHIFCFNTLLYNMNYRRMNHKENMNRKMIMINLISHGIIALIMVSVAIYLSYFK